MQSLFTTTGWRKLLCGAGILLLSSLFLLAVPAAAADDWYLTGENGIHPESAWNYAQYSDGKGDIVIGLLSTGIDYTLPELASVIYTATDGSHGYNFITGSSEIIDTEGNGTKNAQIIPILNEVITM